MLNQFSRTQLLLGQDGMDRLANARVAVFGVGGVGGFTVEALARSGVGAIDLIDDDKVCLTNINRQIIALRSTVGKYKVDVAAERLHDINQNIQKAQSGILRGTAHASGRRYGEQLPHELHLSAGSSAQVHGASGYSGQQCVCAVGCRLDYRRRSD